MSNNEIITNMQSYGITDEIIEQIAIKEKEEGFIPARVIKVHKESYRVISLYGENNAKLKGSIFYQNPKYQTYPAVGDFVVIKPNNMGDDTIHRVLPRKTVFSRANPTFIDDVTGACEQVAAANFDYVFIVTSLNADFNLRRLERYLTVSYESGATPIVLLTKADLYKDYEEKVLQVEQIAPFVPIIAISAHTGFHMDELVPYLSPGKTIVLLGSSGVGKSSLVNAIAKTEIMKVNGIREDDSKGRHTTTHRELILLDNGVILIDTPGMRVLGMWEVNEGFHDMFSDILDLEKKCKFSDCKHESEPGCAIKEAIFEGRLNKERLLSYHKLQREAKFSAKKAAYLKNKSLKNQNYRKVQQPKLDSSIS